MPFDIPTEDGMRHYWLDDLHNTSRPLTLLSIVEQIRKHFYALFESPCNLVYPPTRLILKEAMDTIGAEIVRRFEPGGSAEEQAIIDMIGRSDSPAIVLAAFERYLRHIYDLDRDPSDEPDRRNLFAERQHCYLIVLRVLRGFYAVRHKAMNNDGRDVVGIKNLSAIVSICDDMARHAQFIGCGFCKAPIFRSSHNGVQPATCHICGSEETATTTAIMKWPAVLRTNHRLAA